ncbi:MAG: hypothetical protein M1835_002087 [Candelina submexicana]|nr:MAG: hypothetical protein M1835_002087 [Candelina submexicana]
MDQQDPRYSIPVISFVVIEQIQSDPNRRSPSNTPASKDPTNTDFCHRYCFNNYHRQTELNPRSLRNKYRADNTIYPTIGVATSQVDFEIDYVSQDRDCATLLNRRVDENPTICSGDPALCGIAITRDNASPFEDIAPRNWSTWTDGKKFWVIDNTSFLKPECLPCIQ